jgi:hypothetical protein
LIISLGRQIIFLYFFESQNHETLFSSMPAETAEITGNNLDENQKKREEEYAKVRLSRLCWHGRE